MYFWGAGVVADLAPQVGDVDLHRPFVRLVHEVRRDVLLTAHRQHQVGLAAHPPAGAQQRREQVELGAGEVDAAAVDRHDAGVVVEREPVEPDPPALGLRHAVGGLRRDRVLRRRLLVLRRGWGGLLVLRRSRLLVRLLLGLRLGGGW